MKYFLIGLLFFNPRVFAQVHEQIRTGLFLEPYIGYMMGSADVGYSTTGVLIGSSVEDRRLDGLGLGGRFGLLKDGFFLALNQEVDFVWLRSPVSPGLETGRYTSYEIVSSILAGYLFENGMRIWGGFIPLTLNYIQSEGDGGSSTYLGNGFKLGFSWTSNNEINYNIEFFKKEYDQRNGESFPSSYRKGSNVVEVRDYESKGIFFSVSYNFASAL